MQNKLLPCPCCGGEAKIHNVEPHTHILAKFMPDCKCESFIECTKCTCAMSGDTEEEVVNAWNTRKPMERIVEQLEARHQFYENRFAEMSGTDRDVEDWGSIKSYKDAIDIVRNGGKEQRWKTF